MTFKKPVTLGNTDLTVGRLGLGASYNPPAIAFEIAFDQGCNYFYWTSRRAGMRDAIQNLCAQGLRDQLVVAIQSYSRSAFLMERSLAKALKTLGIDHADVFVLGWHNKAPAGKLIDKALDMKQRGMFRYLGMSGHNRRLFPKMAALQVFDLFHVRYNAAHRGAESEAFSHLDGAGVVSYTATRWGHLLKPDKMPPNMAPPSSADCYRFALSNPAVDVCLCGPSSFHQMQQALQALKAGPMDHQELERMRAIGDHVHQQRSFFQ